jgi:hypothetical protein
MPTSTTDRHWLEYTDQVNTTKQARKHTHTHANRVIENLTKMNAVCSATHSKTKHYIHKQKIKAANKSKTRKQKGRIEGAEWYLPEACKFRKRCGWQL